MAFFETRAPHRVLAALPDAVSALWLLYYWLRPLHVGRDGILLSLGLMALELPALMALAVLLSGFAKGEFLDKAGALIKVGTLFLLIWVVASKHFGPVSIFPLAGAIASVAIGKWLIFWSTRRDSTWFVEGMKLAIHFLTLMLLMWLCTDLPIPRLGFTFSAIEQLQLPAEHWERDAQGSIWVTQPWRTLAAGTLYFVCCAISRFFLSVTSDPEAEPSRAWKP